MAKKIIDEFIKGYKYISAIVFVTNSRRTKRILNKYLKQYNAADKFRINIMGDFEKGKKWLVSK